MTFTTSTRIAPSGDFGRIIVSDKTSTKEMSLQEFCHLYNRDNHDIGKVINQLNASLSAMPVLFGVAPIIGPQSPDDNGPAPVQASDFPCLAMTAVLDMIGFSSVNYDFLLSLSSLVSYKKNPIFFNDTINQYISVTKTTFSELKPGNHFYAEKEYSHKQPLTPASLSDITSYYILREDFLWFGNSEGEILNIRKDWFDPETPVFLFTLKES